MFAALGNFFICPALLAQKDFLLAALALLLGLLSVTAVCNFDPGFLRLYFATPLAVIPAPAGVGLLSPLYTDIPCIPVGFLLGLPCLGGVLMLLIESEDHQ